jgi:uncharacterized protein (DUF924 family)
MTSIACTDVINFWRDAGPKRWFQKDDAFDTLFRNRFIAAHEAAARGDLDSWTGSAEGALGLVILLDQFPRNAFRGTARMYATDRTKAREVARAAVASRFDQQVDPQLRQFFYLPFMHSEELADQDRCVQLNEPLGGESARYALHHRDIIARFGRFPHRNASLGRRNALLGRTSTPEESRYIDEGGFGG